MLSEILFPRDGVVVASGFMMLCEGVSLLTEWNVRMLSGARENKGRILTINTALELSM